MTAADHDVPSDNTTLTEVIDRYREAGFTADFFAEEGRALRCSACGSVVDAGRVSAHSIRRLEGASDPADMLALVAATCPECGAQGTAVLGYGPMASAADADVFTALRDRRDDDVLPPNSAPDDGAH